MCGIAGYIKSTDDPGLDLAAITKRLLWHIEQRGWDASGYAYRKPGGNLVVAKAPVRASEMINRAPIWQSWPQPDEMLLHTRSRTQGTQFKNENNHPLVCEDSGLVMVHNGWLLNEDEVVKEFKINKQAEVDSETLLNLISRTYRKQGKVKKSIAAGMKYLVGAFACGMLSNDKPGELWTWRRDNPLNMAINTSRTLLVFASTKEALMYALPKGGFKYWEVPVDKIFGAKRSNGVLKGMLYDLPEEMAPEHKLYGYSYGGGKYGYYGTEYPGMAETYSPDNYALEDKKCVICGDGFQATEAEGVETCVRCDKSGMRVTTSMFKDVEEYAKERKDVHHGARGVNADDEMRRCIACGKKFKVWAESVYLSCFDCDKLLAEPITIMLVQKDLGNKYGRLINECRKAGKHDPGVASSWRAAFASAEHREDSQTTG